MLFTTHDVAEADMMGASLLLGVGQHRLESLEVRVDIAEDCKTHG